ncbi:MAG: hypothetical protein IT372_05955 [Polyangiaceae bacterium]|nr:hypothetical protein [Polyangiaceae bacterium]
MGRPFLAPLALSLAALAAPAAARADGAPTLSGAWSASGVSEQWSITSWGDACGPKPRPQGAPGGAVQIKQQGSELSIAGAGRAWSTAECWEQMPGLARTSHSASGNARAWRTRCSTPANDPRRATVVTTTSATDSSITMTETGQYQFVIHDTTCTASVTRSRSYSLVRREGEEPPAPSASASAPPPPSAAPATPPPAPAASEARPATPRACDAPGEPARLEVTPSRKLMRPGERFQFRALVLDAEGCAVPSRPTWSVAPGPLAARASVDPAGALSIADDAGEGELGLTASVGGKGVTVRVEVTSPDKYDALLATRGFNASGESDQAAVATIAAGTIGGRTVVGEDAARARKNTFVAIVGALAVCLGFAALVLFRRGRRGQAVETSPTDEPARSARGERDAEVRLDTADDVSAAPPRAAEPRRPAPMPRGKICPTCGDHYPAEAMFCGKDGTQLVLLN